jgi:hypothetical protein
MLRQPLRLTLKEVSVPGFKKKFQGQIYYPRQVLNIDDRGLLRKHSLDRTYFIEKKSCSRV